MDLTGKKFGRITVLYKLSQRHKDGHARYMCRCECGKEWEVISTNLRTIKECRECRYKHYYYQPDRGKVKHYYYTPDCGKRLLDVMNERRVNIAMMERVTGISRSTIYSFLYDGRDTSSARLAKMCRYCGVSMDYIMGLKASE